MPTKSASILLSFFILFQSFNVHFIDILKLKTLIEHMQFHEDVYGDDIVSFISKHYGEQMKSHQEQSSDEEKDHQKLPFNKNVCIDGGQPLIIDGFCSKLHIDEPIVKKRTFYYHNFYSFLENTDIFQPPKTA